MELKIEKEFLERVPGYRALIIECEVDNSETSAGQREEMAKLSDDIASRYRVEDINKRAAIAATRKAYKACGKDPNRYRPSQEQLMRRIVRGLGLYTVNAVVDAGNMFSLLTGCSVGCFDASKVEGDLLTLGIGRKDEPYEGIGRGPLNIEGLPVFRDSAGGIGTPTSDNERTKIELTTKEMLVTVHLFDPSLDMDEVTALFKDIFSRHCGGRNYRMKTFVVNNI